MPAHMAKAGRAGATALLIALGVVSLISSTAGAIGDPILNRAIDIVPPKGWVPNTFNATKKEELANQSQYKVRVAEEGWKDPTPGQTTDYLDAALFVGPTAWASEVGLSQVNYGCDTNEVRTIQTVPGISNSRVLSCTPAGDKPPSFVIVGWYKGDAVASVQASGLSVASVEQYARQINSAIPSGGFPMPGGSSPLLIALIVAAGVILAGLAFRMVRSRRRAGSASMALVTGPFGQPLASLFRQQHGDMSTYPQRINQSVTQPTPDLPPFRPGGVVQSPVSPGWHPVAGDQTNLAYWDGTQWTAYRQWNGQQWVDPVSTPR